MSELAPKREPPPLSQEYHRAHKQLMLWAGILLIWELVGVDLNRAQAAGGNLGAVIGSIKSPQAVPWVLLILVGYFLFKCTVEWHQCNSSRRQFRVARVDFVSAWAVALFAYSLYVVQALVRAQIADLVSGSIRARSFVEGFLVGALLFFAIRQAAVLMTRGQRLLTTALAFPLVVWSIWAFGPRVYFDPSMHAFKFQLIGLALSGAMLIVIENRVSRPGNFLAVLRTKIKRS